MVALKRFIRCRSGATVIEYALIGGFVSVAAAAVLSTIGNDLVAVYTTIEAGIP